MSSQPQRRRRPLLGLFGLALLAVPGFALGVLAGVAWEDPGLLLGHLLGRSVDVPWGSVAREAQPEPDATAALPEVELPAPRISRQQKLPDVAAAAPKPARPRSEATRPAARPRPEATRLRPEVLSPGSAPRFSVQVGAFSESSAAEALVEHLRGRGFAAYVSPSPAPGAARWRVRVGPQPTREKADAVAARLKAEEKLPTWVLDENAV